MTTEAKVPVATDHDTPENLAKAVKFGAIAGKAANQSRKAAADAIAVYAGDYKTARRGFIIGFASVSLASVAQATLCVDGVRADAVKVPDGRHLRTVEQDRVIATANRAWSRAVNDLGIIKSETRGAKAGSTRATATDAEAAKGDKAPAPKFETADTLIAAHVTGFNRLVMSYNKSRKVLRADVARDAEFVLLIERHAAELKNYVDGVNKRAEVK